MEANNTTSTNTRVNVIKVDQRVAIRAFLGGVEVWVSCPGAGNGQHCIRAAIARAESIGAEVAYASPAWEIADA